MSNSLQVKEWRKRFKKRIVESFGGKCGICGYCKCNEVFHCHHIDPKEKDFSLASITANPCKWEKVVPELRKCVLLCCRCHGEVHAGATEVPQTILRFNEEFATEKEHEKHLIPCPICNKMMPDHQKTCSLKCAAKKRYKVNWDSIDLNNLYNVQKIPQLQIAKMLGCSGSAVKKRLRKLQLIPL